MPFRATARPLAVAACAAAALGGAVAGPTDVEQWVLEAGGAVETASDGQVVAVDLSRCWVSDIDLARLEGLAGLERLSLAQTHISDTALDAVAALPSLRQLDLFFCEHVTDAGASALRRAAKLERLNVRGTKISDSGVKFLAELPRLRALDIGIAEISDPSIELLEAVPGLESLAIGGNRVGEAGIAGLRSLKRLKHLDLSGAQETDSGIWAVTVTDLSMDEIGALTGLESLNLAAPSPEYVDAVSTGVPRLRGAIRVTDFGVARLAGLLRLRRLNLSRALVTDAGIESLSRLFRLEELNLSHAKSIDDRAGPALAMLPGLRTLDVSFTEFGDAGLAALRDHPALIRVVAAEAPLSQEAVATFVAARPGRDVVR